jgi:hypothetical protein
MAMLRTSVKLAWFVVVACILSGGVARAGTIDTLFNTGVDALGQVLPDGTVGDPHYTLISVPVGSTTDTRIRDASSGYPMWQYVGDNLTSRWIGPNNDAYFSGPVGDYIYRTTFNLAGFDPSRANITGRWSTDNFGRQMLLNGIDTGNVNNAEFSVWTAFSITSGFVAGSNTLDFVVENISGPTAVRVEMTGTTVPLPAAAWCGMALLGIMGIIRYCRRKYALA